MKKVLLKAENKENYSKISYSIIIFAELIYTHDRKENF